MTRLELAKSVPGQAAVLGLCSDCAGARAKMLKEQLIHKCIRELSGCAIEFMLALTVNYASQDRP